MLQTVVLRTSRKCGLVLWLWFWVFTNRNGLRLGFETAEGVFVSQYRPQVTLPEQIALLQFTISLHIWVIFHFVYVLNFLICPFADGCLVWLHSLALANKAAMNTDVQVSLLLGVTSTGCVLRYRTYDNFISRFLRNLQTYFQNGRTSLYSTSVYKSFPFTTSMPVFVSICIPHDSHPDWGWLRMFNTILKFLLTILFWEVYVQFHNLF